MKLIFIFYLSTKLREFYPPSLPAVDALIDHGLVCQIRNIFVPPQELQEVMSEPKCSSIAFGSVSM